MKIWEQRLTSSKCFIPWQRICIDDASVLFPVWNVRNSGTCTLRIPFQCEMHFWSPLSVFLESNAILLYSCLCGAVIFLSRPGYIYLLSSAPVVKASIGRLGRRKNKSEMHESRWQLLSEPALPPLILPLKLSQDREGEGGRERSFSIYYYGWSRRKLQKNAQSEIKFLSMK